MLSEVQYLLRHLQNQQLLVNSVILLSIRYLVFSTCTLSKGTWSSVVYNRDKLSMLDR